MIEVSKIDEMKEGFKKCGLEGRREGLRRRKKD